jgi:transcriptional regulator with XRE-family HTH domain
MTLLRRVLGETLRYQRLRQRRTLREVSGAARVSLGYLSEVERGQKEASSELLASICEALDVRMSDVLREVSDTMRRTERVTEVARVPARALVPVGVGAGPAESARGDRAGFAVDGGYESGFESRRDGADAAAATTGPAAPAAMAGTFARTGPAPAVPSTPDDLVPAELTPAGLVPAELTPAGLVPAGLTPAGLTPAGLLPAGLTPAGLLPAEPAAVDDIDAVLEILDLDGVGLDGVDLADLETGDGLGEVEVLLGLTELAGVRGDAPFHPCMLSLAGAAA